MKSEKKEQDRASNLEVKEKQKKTSEYMRELAYKSVAKQNKTKEEFSRMGKLSAKVQKAKREAKRLQELDEAGELATFILE